MLRTEWIDTDGNPAFAETTWNGTETPDEFADRHNQDIKDKIDEVGIKLPLE